MSESLVLKQSDIERIIDMTQCYSDTKNVMILDVFVGDTDFMWDDFITLPLEFEDGERITFLVKNLDTEETFELAVQLTSDGIVPLRNN